MNGGKLKIFFLLTMAWLTVCLHTVFGQDRPIFPKPVIRDGKFIFYGATAKKDSILLHGKTTNNPIVCACGTSSQAKQKHSVVTSGQMVLYITSSDATCGYGSGSIIVQVANGTPPYSFTETQNGFTNPAQNTGNFPVIGAGSHTITVTDATGATASAIVNIANISPGPILVPWNIDKLPSNCSVNDGQVSLNPIGGTPPYTYSLDLVNFQTSNVFSGLYSGIYKFFVKDANGCIGSFSLLGFSSGCDGMVGGAGWATCHGNASFSVTDNNQMGNGPFQYSLDGGNYQPTGDFSNIAYGLHKFYIKDNNGKVQILGFNEFEDCTIGIQYVAVDAACMQNNGSLAITATNGTIPYSYTIDGVNYQSSNQFNNLAPGNYYVTVMDATGVKSSLPVTVYDKCPIVRAVQASETCAKHDGSITAGGFRGTAPYQFSIDGVNFQTNNVFTGLAAGAYTVTIRDALGFTGTYQITVTSSCLNISTTITSTTCGNSNGSLQVLVSLGTAPYQYSLDGTNYQSGNVFSNLAAGTYLVWVRDALGNTSSVTAKLTDISGPQMSATTAPASCANNDGGLTALASGGNSPFLFSIDGQTYQNNPVYMGLDTGVHTISVKDANGCIASQTQSVPLNNSISLTMGIGPETCEGVGVAIPASSNGSSFSWVPTSGLSNASLLNPVATPSESAKYYLTAKLGICTKMDSVMVLVDPAPIPNAGIDTSICFGQSLQLYGSGGANYSWSPSTYLSDPNVQDPIVSQPASSITYNLMVTDNKGCKSLQPSSVAITITPPPKVSAGNDTSVLVNHYLQLHGTDIDHSGFSNYTWSPASGLDNPFKTDPIAYITTDIVYTVTASTANGCVGVDSIHIRAFELSDIFVPNAFTPNGDGRNDVLHAIPIGIKDFQYFAVYNRWGQMVFFTKDPSIGWDGTRNGVPMASGTYIWASGGIDLNNKTISRKGFSILIR